MFYGTNGPTLTKRRLIHHHHQRIHEATMTNYCNKSQAVTFSEHSELYIVPAIEHQEGSAMWYSSQDKQGFRRSMVASIQKVSREIRDLPHTAKMMTDQFIDCLGIESFINESTASSMAEVRRAHMHAILTEQNRQNKSGTCDIERISRISQKGSLSSKERAWKLARGYAALSME
jgi:hypothetical protein